MKMKIKNRIINFFNKTLEIILSVIIVYLIIVISGIVLVFPIFGETKEKYIDKNINMVLLNEKEKRN